MAVSLRANEIAHAAAQGVARALAARVAEGNDSSRETVILGYPAFERKGRKSTVTMKHDG